MLSGKDWHEHCFVKVCPEPREVYCCSAGCYMLMGGNFISYQAGKEN